jgi:hypothetical protein
MIEESSQGRFAQHPTGEAEVISDEEKARRRKMVHNADANNRIEGIYRDPATDVIFEAFVQGDIEATDIITLLNAQLAPR